MKPLLLLLIALVLAGCGSDPVVRAAVVDLRAGAVTLMDEHDRMAVKAGEPVLPKEYREDKTGAYDDLIDYLDGKKPEGTGK